MVMAAALAATLAAPAMAQLPPVALQSWGSFHVGGREVVISGQPVREVLFSPGGVPARVDPNGTDLMGMMYAQYMIPANPRGQAPILLRHGGGLSGVSRETTPDGREGWQHFFLRRGWPVYVSDAVERGRAGWTLIPEQTGGTALVLVEPAAVGDPAKVAALRDIPVLMIHGDYIAQDSRWPTIRGDGVRFAEAVRAAGGSVDVVDLPEIGIRGNSHMIMMDRNSDQVAQVVQDWLARRGLYQ
jgi:acetyl esterase/lipase